MGTTSQARGLKSYALGQGERGGRAEDAFDLVIPSMPGYGFSGKPTTTGWGPEHIAEAWAKLMTRLGYTHYVAQGGDWGAVITDEMGVQAPSELLGIHSNMPGTLSPEVSKAVAAGDPAPSGLSDEERRAWERLAPLRWWPTTGEARAGGRDAENAGGR